VSARHPAHHPADELLLAFAAGEADLAHRVLVEAHLAGCAACAGVVAEMSAAGGALLAALPEVAPPPSLWRALERRVAGAEAVAARRWGLDPAGSARGGVAATNDGAPRDLPLPAAARAELPPGPRPRWRWLWAPGARWALLHESPDGTRLMAGRMPGGLTFPRHRHVGPEDVVLLSGAYEDQEGRFAVGDYASYPPGSEHEPRTVAGEVCTIVFRLEAPNRFFGWRGLLQRLAGAA
jgi:putative transcriptional regulator